MKEKTNGFYVGLAAAVIACVAGIALYLYANAVADPYPLAPGLLIAGAVIALLALFSNVHFLLLVPGVAYIAAFALYLSSQMENISAKLSANGVGDTGTSLTALGVFLALMLLAAILSVVSCYMKQRRV